MSEAKKEDRTAKESVAEKRRRVMQLRKGNALIAQIPQVKQVRFGTFHDRHELNDLKLDQKKVINPNRILKYGDADGNTADMIRYLAEEGVIDISNADYKRLATIYLDSGESVLTKAQLNEFTSILLDPKRVKFHPESLQRLVLIGDTLADRGNNDLLTLALYTCLHDKEVPFTLMLSNHDSVFLSAVASAEDYAKAHPESKDSKDSFVFQEDIPGRRQ